MKIDLLPMHSLYWQRPVSELKGDSDADKLYAAVGRALSDWETLEEAFAKIFQALLNSESPAAKRAYGAIVTARGRKEVLAAAAEAYFTTTWTMYDEKAKQFYKNAQSRLKLLERHFGEAASLRNDVAHGVVKLVQLRKEAGAGYFLVPSGYNSSKNKLYAEHDEDWHVLPSGKYRYTSEQIADIALRFVNLHDAAEEYVEEFKRTFH